MNTPTTTTPRQGRKTHDQLRKAELLATMRAHVMCARWEMAYHLDGGAHQSFSAVVNRVAHYYRLAISYRDMARGMK